MFGTNRASILSNTNTITKPTETSFHLRLVSEAYHQVRPKWFLSLWYVWRKPGTYLAPTLTLSPNGPKRDSTWPMSPRSSIRFIQNDSQPMVRSVQTLDLSCIKISTNSKWTKQAPTWVSSVRHTIGCIQNNFWAYGTFGANHAPILHRHYSVSKWTETRFHMTHVT
jgi:hypothetical protein